jgi:hypothetical protein
LIHCYTTDITLATLTTWKAFLMSRKQDLMRRLNITPDDLAHNRRGVMSPRQQARFLRRGRIRALGCTVSGGFCAAMIAQGWRSGGIDVNLYAAQIANAIFFGWLSWTVSMTLFKDGAAGRTEQATGKLGLYSSRSGTVVTVGKSEFLPPVELSEPQVQPGKTYCAYYAPNTGRLLALEPKAPPRKPEPTTKRGRKTGRSRQANPYTSRTPRLGVRSR